MMICSVKGCDDPVRYKGLCGKHYKRLWRHGSVLETQLQPAKGLTCTTVGCDLPMKAKGMCKACHLRFLRRGTTDRLIAKRGLGRPETTAGYVLLTREGERIYEHVYVAQQALGKELPPGAVIHHVNGKPNDNRPENLVICPSQAYHLLLHRRQIMLEMLGKIPA